MSPFLTEEGGRLLSVKLNDETSSIHIKSQVRVF